MHIIVFSATISICYLSARRDDTQLATRTSSSYQGCCGSIDSGEAGKCDDDVVRGELTQDGYNLDVPRHDRKPGGIILLYRDNLNKDLDPMPHGRILAT